MKMMTKIFDTSSLLLIADSLFDQSDDKIVITSVTLAELENIKVSANKDASIKYAARQLLHQLDKHSEDYECYLYKPAEMNEPIARYGLDVINNDNRILATAYHYMQTHQGENCVFYTNDLALKHIASIFFGGSRVQSIDVDDDDYTGYKDFYFSDEEMAYFYSHLNDFGQECMVNEYINIHSKSSSERVDTMCWTGNSFRQLKYKSFYSKQLGEVKPYKGDIYQAMVADSLLNNKITMIKGPAGAGKTHLALGFLFYLLEKGKIDRIIIFCNTVATKNSAKLGFYPGTKDEKLMDSQMGNLLASKLGGKIAVEQLITDEKIVLLPMSDIRGYDASGMNAGIYISEAQNLDIPLLKLALQRAGEDSIFILDGDTKSQVDMTDYEGFNNGMRRASKVFRGHDIYGEITLKQIHRSKIAELADKM